MQRYFIQISYDGTAYNGWQIQQNSPNTIQQKLNEALSVLFNETVECIGCGRTDTGVHAKDFYAHFDCKNETIITDKEKWIYKFNSFLPKDIAVLNFYKVTDSANARFDAIGRTYEYIISKTKNPFLLDKAYYYSGELNLEYINKACLMLFEFNDFSCFSKSNTQTATNNCKIMKAEFVSKGDNYIFTIKADRFLRNMVRAIMGTLIDIGKEKITIEDFRKIIEGKNRSDAGFSVPACGLYLVKVEYPQNYFNE